MTTTNATTDTLSTSGSQRIGSFWTTLHINRPRIRNSQFGESVMFRVHCSLTKLSVACALLISSSVATGHAWAAELDHDTSKEAPIATMVGVVSGTPPSRPLLGTAMTGGNSDHAATASTPY